MPRPWSSRRWLAAAGIALVVACLVPPLSVLARRYLFVESIQFCVFALAAPALVALGATLRLGAPGAEGLLTRGAGRLAPCPAGVRHRWTPFVALSYLIAWVVLGVFWRLPSVLDGLARHPVLVLPEAGVAFAPVVFTVLLNWLKESSEPRAGPAGRVPDSGVRGWGHR